ncbi:polymerase [Lacticaseibacillus paracasei subsp. paracasei]|nr:polymerase [Lacticaseibacillus paracasei subsp. paracasei]
MIRSKGITGMLEFFLCTMLIVSFRTVWMYTENQSISRFFTIAVFLSIFLLFTAYIVFYRATVTINDFSIFLLIAFTVLVCMIISQVSGNGLLLVRHLAYFGLMIILFLARRQKRLNSIITKFVSVCSIIAALSLFFWILAILGVPPTSSLSINWSSQFYTPIKGFIGLFYFSQDYTSFLGLYLPRNTAIFTEAPMCSFVFCLAFLFDTFIVPKTQKDHLTPRQILLIVAIISTTSTTGVMIVILSLAAMFFKNVKINPIVIIVGLIIVTAVILILWQLFLAKTSENSDSVNIRFDDIQAGAKAWLLHPIFGNGLEKTLAYLPFIQGYRVLVNGNSGFSSGIFQILMTGGLFYFTVIFLFPCVRMFRSNRNYFFLSALFLVMLFNTVIYDTYLMYFLSALFYALTLKGEVSERSK